MCGTLNLLNTITNVGSILTHGKREVRFTGLQLTSDLASVSELANDSTKSYTDGFMAKGEVRSIFSEGHFSKCPKCPKCQFVEVSARVTSNGACPNNTVPTAPPSVPLGDARSIFSEGILHTWILIEHNYILHRYQREYPANSGMTGQNPTRMDSSQQ
jgi:hypothetical protein